MTSSTPASPFFPAYRTSPTSPSSQASTRAPPTCPDFDRLDKPNFASDWLGMRGHRSYISPAHGQARWGPRSRSGDASRCSTRPRWPCAATCPGTWQLENSSFSLETIDALHVLCPLACRHRPLRRPYLHEQAVSSAWSGPTAASRGSSSSHWWTWTSSLTATVQRSGVPSTPTAVRTPRSVGC